MGCQHSHAKIRGRSDVIDSKSFRFEVIIGQGGFGKVNAAMRKRDKSSQWYAIKTVYKRRLLDTGKGKGVAMIFTERNILVKMRSNNHIVHVHHCFQDRKAVYLVMDFLSGGDLRFHLSKAKRFSEATARFYLASLFLALEAIHSRGILHRDIKPENLLLDSRGFLRLTDFGVSTIADPNDRFVSSTRGSGTRAYMSPEVFSKSKYHSIASDYWMAGVILYETVLGRRPFRKRVDAAMVEWMEATWIDKKFSAKVPTCFTIRIPRDAVRPSDSYFDLVSRLMDIRPWARMMKPGTVKTVMWSHLGGLRSGRPRPPSR